MPTNQAPFRSDIIGNADGRCRLDGDGEILVWVSTKMSRRRRWVKNGLVAGTGGVTVESIMKTLPEKRNISGFTLIEALVVICVIAVLAAMLLPAINGGPHRANRVMCLSNLKQIVLNFHVYASDFGGTLPMQVSALNGGTREFIYTDHAFPHFEKIRRYAGAPQLLRILVCPSDKSRQAATNYEALNDLNISYFLNADASLTNINLSQAIFAGERDLTLNRQPVMAGLLMATTNVDLNWTGEFHPKGGNLAFADGHAEWSKIDTLNALIRQQPLATNRLCIP
jgi:prepilin-type processing-associated H-X9-DG protein